MYRLYIDKPSSFKCKIELEGASLKNAKSRVVLESLNKPTVLFEGKIDSSGTCTVPISKINEFYESNDSGTMKLEVIADGAFFEPWQSEFEVLRSKQLRVEVITEDHTINKPTMSVVVDTEQDKLLQHISNDMKRVGITVQNIKHKKPLALKIIKKYLHEFDDSIQLHELLSNLLIRLEK